MVGGSIKGLRPLAASIHCLVLQRLGSGDLLLLNGGKSMLQNLGEELCNFISDLDPVSNIMCSCFAWDTLKLG